VSPRAAKARGYDAAPEAAMRKTFVWAQLKGSQEVYGERKALRAGLHRRHG